MKIFYDPYMNLYMPSYITIYDSMYESYTILHYLYMKYMLTYMATSVTIYEMYPVIATIPQITKITIYYITQSQFILFLIFS